eukprot:8040188-Pyramimonas_sp.AAC.1
MRPMVNVPTLCANNGKGALNTPDALDGSIDPLKHATPSALPSTPPPLPSTIRSCTTACTRGTVAPVGSPR